MGKGLIVSGGTDGLYTIKLLHDRARIDAELQALGEQLTQLQVDLDALETEREGMVAERNAIATDIDTAIANTEEGEIPDVEALLAELAQVSAQIQSIDVRIGMLKGRMLVAKKRKQQLELVPEDPQQSAWCADLTEDLTGEVATVEVPAEGVVGQFATWRRVQIRPGHEGRANYLPARDGQMFHREGQEGYQAFYNAAILPGVQRWRPQYRIGVIDTINYEADTCSLTIQGEDSSAQSLIIDPPDLQYSKTGVPIEYMDCNADPFEVGDRVLVEFQGRDWNQPKVIGFESEPKMCGITVNYLAASGLVIVGDTPQTVEVGGSTTPVAVGSTAAFDVIFTEWDDLRTDNPRSDTNVQEPFTVTALGTGNPGFPVYISLQPWSGPNTAVLSAGGSPAVVEGDLATGRTTTWSEYQCSDESGAAFSAFCREARATWMYPDGFGWNAEFTRPDWIVVHSPDPCTIQESGVRADGTYTRTVQTSAFAPGVPDSNSWRHNAVSMDQSMVWCGADAPAGQGWYDSWVGTEFAIESTDWGLFWSMVSPPASVSIVHESSGLSLTYYKAEVSGRRQRYRPLIAE